eukprot:scaffold1834_cov175-Amphora_coffeaeformis.AAC.16
MDRSSVERDETYSGSDDDGSNHVSDIANSQLGHDDFDFDPDVGLDNLIANVEGEHVVDVAGANLAHNSPHIHPERRIGIESEIRFAGEDSSTVQKGDSQTKSEQKNSARQAADHQAHVDTGRAGRPSFINTGPCRRPKMLSQDAALAIINDRFSGHARGNTKKRRKSPGRLPQGREKYGRFRKLRDVSSQEMLDSSKARGMLLLPDSRPVESKAYQRGKYRQRPDKIGPYSKTKKKQKQAQEDEEDNLSSPSSNASNEHCERPFPVGTLATASGPAGRCVNCVNERLLKFGSSSTGVQTSACKVLHIACATFLPGHAGILSDPPAVCHRNSFLFESSRSLDALLCARLMWVAKKRMDNLIDPTRHSKERNT